MPRAIYILCCESMNIDQLTGLPSYINVYDTLTVGILPFPIAASPPVPQLLKMRVSALWALEPGEQFGRTYEHQFLFRNPSGSELPSQALSDQPPAPPAPVTFIFDKQFYRADAIIQGHPFSGPGIYRIESRLRELGAGEWLSQYFPLRVEIIRHTLDLTPRS